MNCWLHIIDNNPQLDVFSPVLPHKGFLWPHDQLVEMTFLFQLHVTPQFCGEIFGGSECFYCKTSNVSKKAPVHEVFNDILWIISHNWMFSWRFLYWSAPQRGEGFLTTWSADRNDVFLFTAGDGGGRERPDRPVWPGGSGAGDPGHTLLAASRRPPGRLSRRRIRRRRHQHGHQARTDKNRDAGLEQGTKVSFIALARNSCAKIAKISRQFVCQYCKTEYFSNVRFFPAKI